MNISNISEVLCVGETNLIVLSFVMDIFNVIVIHFFLSSYFEKIVVKKYYIVLLWLSYIISSNLIMKANIPILNLLLTFAFIFGITWFVFRPTIKNSILIALFIIAINMIAEVFVAISLISTLNVDGTTLTEVPRYLTVATTYSKLVEFILLRIALLFSKQKRDKEFSNINWIIVVVIPFGSICLIYNTILGEGDSLMSNLTLQNLLSITIILSINLFVFYLYDKIIEDTKLKLQNELYEQQTSYYLKQYQEYEESNFEIRQLRHDLKNQLIMFQEYLKKGELKKVDSLIHLLIDEKLTSKNHVQTNNLQIDAVLNYKLEYAKKYNIKFELLLEVPRELFVHELDLCVILGNALDNAIEACKKISEPERIINVTLKYKNDTLYIAIQNKMLEASFIKNGSQILTSKEDKKKHGIGLKSIEKVINKYNGSLQINTLSNNQFQLEVFLYKN